MNLFGNRGAVPVLAGVVLVCLATGLWFLTFYPLDIPIWREFYFVGIATERVPLDWTFVSEPTAEHALPLPMALGGWLVRATGVAGANRVLNLVILVVAVLIVLRSVRIIRGHLEVRDITIVLVMTGAGQWFNFLSGFNLQMVLSGAAFAITASATIALAVAPSGSSLAFACVALLVQPLVGVNGIISATFSGLALAIVLFRTRHSLRRRWILFGSGTLLLAAASTLYFLPWNRMEDSYPQRMNPVRLAAELFSAEFGEAGAHASPWSVIVMLILVVGTVALLVRARNLRLPAVVVFLGFAALIVTAVAVGLSRAKYPNALQFTPRYVPLAMVWSVLVSIGLTLLRDNPWAGRLSNALVVVMLAASAWNVPLATRALRGYERQAKLFVRDSRAGKSLAELHGRHGQVTFPFSDETFFYGVSTLMLEGQPPFAGTPHVGWLRPGMFLNSPCCCARGVWLKASSNVPSDRDKFRPEAAIDGTRSTAWRSATTGPSELDVRLEAPGEISRVCVFRQELDPASRVDVELLLGEQVLRRESLEFDDQGLGTVATSPLSVDRLRLHVPAGTSIEEVQFASTPVLEHRWKDD
jgi:hypothetical protein